MFDVVFSGGGESIDESLPEPLKGIRRAIFGRWLDTGPVKGPMTMNPMELKGALEAIIYAADELATLDQIANAVGEEKSVVRTALDEMIAGYAGEDWRVWKSALLPVATGVYTKPQHHDVVRRFIKSLRPPLRLTMPALETLAVISYRQPVTGPEIQEIRGVNVSGVVKTLLEKRLITTAGRKAG